MKTASDWCDGCLDGANLWVCGWFAADSRCQVRVDSTTPAASRSTFYEIWEGVIAISYMCLRRSDIGGRASKIGVSITKC